VNDQTAEDLAPIRELLDGLDAPIRARAIACVTRMTEVTVTLLIGELEDEIAARAACQAEACSAPATS
jgi:hypothetical protein